MLTLRAHGDRGRLSLPGRPADHRMFADHVAASEFKGGTGVSPVNHGRDGHATSVRTEGRARTVNE